jgi:hypothetical protein
LELHFIQPTKQSVMSPRTRVLLSQSRIVAICVLTILSMLPVFIIYDEWVRHFVDSIAKLFLPDGICSSTDDYQGCDRAIEVYRLGEKLGYGIYSILFYFGCSLTITRLLVGDRSFEFKETLIFYTMCITVPFVVSCALGTWIEVLFFHFLFVYPGFLVGVLFLKSKHNKAQNSMNELASR